MRYEGFIMSILVRSPPRVVVTAPVCKTDTLNRGVTQTVLYGFEGGVLPQDDTAAS